MLPLDRDRTTRYARHCPRRPTQRQLHDELGINLARQARHAEAITLFERALQLDPHAAAYAQAARRTRLRPVDVARRRTATMPATSPGSRPQGHRRRSRAAARRPPAGSHRGLRGRAATRSRPDRCHEDARAGDDGRSVARRRHRGAAATGDRTGARLPGRLDRTRRALPQKQEVAQRSRRVPQGDTARARQRCGLGRARRRAGAGGLPGSRPPRLIDAPSS